MLQASLCSSHLEIWLIPSDRTRSRQYEFSTMVWLNLLLYHLFQCFVWFFQRKELDNRKQEGTKLQGKITTAHHAPGNSGNKNWQNSISSHNKKNTSGGAASRNKAKNMDKAPGTGTGRSESRFTPGPPEPPTQVSLPRVFWDFFLDLFFKPIDPVLFCLGYCQWTGQGGGIRISGSHQQGFVRFFLLLFFVSVSESRVTGPLLFLWRAGRGLVRVRVKHYENRVNVFSTAKFADRRELLEGARTERRDWDKRLALGAVSS